MKIKLVYYFYYHNDLMLWEGELRKVNDTPLSVYIDLFRKGLHNKETTRKTISWLLLMLSYNSLNLLPFTSSSNSTFLVCCDQTGSGHCISRYRLTVYGKSQHLNGI